MLRIKHTLIVLFIIITLYKINCDSVNFADEIRSTLIARLKARDGIKDFSDESRSSSIDFANEIRRALLRTGGENVIEDYSLKAGSRTRSWMKLEKIKTPSGKSVSIISPKSRSKKCGRPAKFVRLYKDGRMSRKEYEMVSSEVAATKTTGCIKILKIRKVSNGCLWDRYKSRREDIMTESNVSDTNERLLFYGTDVWNKTTDGFDERLSQGGSFGAGIYFTDKFSKADSDAAKDGLRHVLLNRVILGMEFKVIGSKVYAHAPIGHDSVVGKQAGNLHDDYVVYKGEQAYPEYVITYKTCD